MGFIYKITNPNNKIYIGKTYCLRKRINGHKSHSKKGFKHILYNSIRKYGWDLHKLEVIEEIEDGLMNEREMYWIEKFNTYYQSNPQGMNMTLGGEGQRSSWIKDTKRRKEQSEKFSKEGNPFYGKKHSEETRKIMSKSASERNLKDGRKVPEWGVEKGRKKVMRPVLCYNSNGEFIKEYESATAAALSCGLSKASQVCEVCSGKRTNASGFVFRYKKYKIPQKISIKKINKANVKRPVLYINGKTMIEYPSAMEASKSLKIPKTTIIRASCYNNMKPIRSGHIFIYKDLFINNPTAVGVF